MRTTTTITREADDEEYEIDIEADYIRGRAETYYVPEEYPEVEILSAFIGNEEVELTDKELEKARQQILSDPPHDY